MTAPGKPVFPLPGKDAMNLKEYFAILALQGILSGPLAGSSQAPIQPADAANRAVDFADALIKVL
jgi:hypothetical protein